MKTLYTKNGMIGKLWEHISPIFSDAVQPTRKHLFNLMLALNGFQSVKFCFEHFIQNLSTYQLKSYYYTLSRPCLIIGSAPSGEGFFCQSRQIFAGILTDFKKI